MSDLIYGEIMIVGHG